MIWKHHPALHLLIKQGVILQEYSFCHVQTVGKNEISDICLTIKRCKYHSLVTDNPDLNNAKYIHVSLKAPVIYFLSIYLSSAFLVISAFAFFPLTNPLTICACCDTKIISPQFDK